MNEKEEIKTILALRNPKTQSRPTYKGDRWVL